MRWAISTLLPFFILFSQVNITIVRNIVVVLGLFVLTKYTYANLIRQSIIMRAQLHDTSIANRILYRIESLDGIDFSKTYDLIRLGYYSNIRLRA